MIFWRHYLLLFGGFHDTSSITKYHNDFWVFDTVEEKWTEIKAVGGRSPEPRSGFTFLPSMEGGVVIGGYAKVKGNAGKLRGVIYNGTICREDLLMKIFGQSKCLLICRKYDGNEDERLHFLHRMHPLRTN